MERNKAVSLNTKLHCSGNSYTVNPEESMQSVDIMENTHTRNNNDTFFGLHLSDFTVKTSIDKMNISVNPLDPDLIVSKLLRHYYFINKSIPKGDRYDHIVNFKNELNKVSLLYSNKIYVRPLFIIHDPTPAVVDIFISVFKALDKNGIDPKISLLELAWDFYSDNFDHLLRLKESIDRHLFLRYQRLNSYDFENDGTFYTTNLRRAVKGTRSYLGPKKGKKEYVRLEVELHRRKIGDLDITFPIRSHHLDIDFSKIFEFRWFDVEKFRKRTFKWHRVQLAQKKKDQIRSGKTSYSIILNLIEKRLNWLIETPLMEVIDYLKDRNIKDYHHFLYTMENENRIVYQVADEQRFGFF